MQGDVIGQVTGGTLFSNNAPKNPREWIYRPPDATQSFKINQKLLNNAVLKDGTFSTKLYEEGKLDSQWGRMIGINYQTNPNTRVGWEKTKEGTKVGWEKTKEGAQIGWEKTKEGTVYLAGKTQQGAVYIGEKGKDLAVKGKETFDTKV